MTSARGKALRERLTINPDEAPPAQPAVEPQPEPAAPPAPPPAPAERKPAAAPRSARRAAPKEPARTALEDPAIRPGRKDYRSFYVDDAPFARFRAAIFWASRNPDAADEGVPENMSAAIEEHMLDVAADLERRFNGGEVFRMPPVTKRRSRKSDESGK